MARWRRTASTLILVAGALAIAGCGGSPGDPVPDPVDEGAGGERIDQDRFTADTACLVDGSPWSLDLEAMLTDYVAAVNDQYPAEGQATSWLASGTATMSFIDGTPQLWQFRADGVGFDIAAGGPLQMVSQQAEEQNGEFAVIEGGFIMVQFAESLTHEVSNLWSLPDGSVSEQFAAWPPPVFAWSLDIAGGTSTHTMAFTCSETELVIDGVALYDSRFVPGR